MLGESKHIWWIDEDSSTTTLLFLSLLQFVNGDRVKQRDFCIHGDSLLLWVRTLVFHLGASTDTNISLLHNITSWKVMKKAMLGRASVIFPTAPFCIFSFP